MPQSKRNRLWQQKGGKVWFIYFFHKLGEIQENFEWESKWGRKVFWKIKRVGESARFPAWMAAHMALYLFLFYLKASTEDALKEFVH